MVNNPPANAGDSRDLHSIPGSGRSPGEGNGYPPHYSCLENSMDRGAWWTIVHGVTKSWIRLSDWHFHFFFFPIHCLIGSFSFLQIVAIDWLEISCLSLPVSSWENIWMPPDLWPLFHLLISQVTDNEFAIIFLITLSTLGNKLCLRLEKWTHFNWWGLESKTPSLSVDSAPW